MCVCLYIYMFIRYKFNASTHCLSLSSHCYDAIDLIDACIVQCYHIQSKNRRVVGMKHFFRTRLECESDDRRLVIGYYKCCIRTTATTTKKDNNSKKNEHQLIAIIIITVLQTTRSMIYTDIFQVSFY